MANFQVLDAYGSVITIQSSTFGSAERQIVGASIIGTFPVTISGNPSISGTVNVGNIPSVNATVVGNVSVSGTVGASIIGAVNINPASVQVLNPVSLLAVNPNPASVQVLNPVSILAVTQSGAWSASLVGTIPGSVVAFQGGTWQPSALGYVTRNDAVASFLGANLTTRPAASDSAGRTLVKPFAPEESRIEGTISLTSTSVTTVIAAPGAGLRNYITDFMIANSGSVTTLVTFKDNAGSVLGYTIAPATGGSNAPGLATPIRTGVNAAFDIQAAGFTSTLYGTFTGFKAH